MRDQYVVERFGFFPVCLKNSSVSCSAPGFKPDTSSLSFFLRFPLLSFNLTCKNRNGELPPYPSQYESISAHTMRTEPESPL